jgi:pSer/pThr/pTyr-binding forkhead associated (FHA) protein
VKCPKCSNWNPVYRTICKFCRAPLEAVPDDPDDEEDDSTELSSLRRAGECAKCGRINPPELTICKSCGAPTSTPKLIPGRLMRGPVHSVQCPPHAPVILEAEVPSLIGRAAGCDLVLLGDHVSRRHCQVLLREEMVRLKDLGSSNGTFYDGAIIHREITLAPGDFFLVGGFRVTYILKQPSSQTPSEVELVEAQHRSETVPMQGSAPVGLQGLAEEVSIPEILLLLHETRRSGALVVQAAQVSGVIHLDWGEIVAASLSNPTELSGMDAVLLLATVRQGEFTFTNREWIGIREIEDPTPQVLQACVGGGDDV